MYAKQSFLIVALLLFFTTKTLGQVEKRVVEERAGEVRIETEKPFSSIVVKASIDLEAIELIILGDTFLLTENPHVEDLLSLTKTSNLVFLPENASSLVLIKPEGELEIYFIEATERSTAERRPLRTAEGDAYGLVFITHEEWKTDLVEKEYERIENKVDHIIIHHSATANDIVDYTGLVRDIYVWHTEGNNWSDIGYNYLIAPDGSVYDGRDPGESNLAQDNVMGAHFCAKNAGTMGICMLGTFTNVAPTDKALEALTQLITWKAEKEGINVLGSSIHNGTLLDNVTGHRGGCNTECPGTTLFNRLDDIKQDAVTLASLEGYYNRKLEVYPNPITKEQNLQMEFSFTDNLLELNIIDGKGNKFALPFNCQDNKCLSTIKDFSPAIYTLEAIFEEGMYNQRVIITKER